MARLAEVWKGERWRGSRLKAGRAGVVCGEVVRRARRKRTGRRAVAMIALLTVTSGKGRQLLVKTVVVVMLMLSTGLGCCYGRPYPPLSSRESLAAADLSPSIEQPQEQKLLLPLPHPHTISSHPPWPPEGSRRACTKACAPNEPSMPSSPPSPDASPASSAVWPPP